MFRVPDHISPSLREVPELIRVWSLQSSGQIKELREELHLLKQRRIKPAWSLALARAARFVGLPEMALRFLERRVRTRGSAARIQPGANSAEIAEYALALNDLGASREAIEFFSQIDKSKVLDAEFIEASIHLKRWDWDRARGHFEAELTAKNSTEYCKISSRHFIASCLLYGNDDAQGAIEALDEAGRLARKNGHANIESAVRFMEAQSFMAMGDSVAALRSLEQFKAFAQKQEQPVLLLLAEQWKHIIALRDSPREAKAGLADVTRRLLAAGAWEWARSSDYHLALRTTDVEAFRRAYYGTPYRKFRERIASLWEKRFKMPPPVGESFEWSVPPSGSKHVDASPAILDALTGRNSRGSGLLKPGQVPQRLLLMLVSDLYRPLSIGTIHERIYPGEKFHPESSIAKIHQALQRLRRWLASEGLPLVIEEKEGIYLLRSTSPCLITIPAPTMLISLDELREKVPHVEVTRALERLVSIFQERSFSSTEAARALGVSRASANRYLAEALRFGALHASGKARATRYLLPGAVS